MTICQHGQLLGGDVGLNDMTPTHSKPLPPDPVIEAYKKDVDVTLLDANLKLTHEQRIRQLQRMLEAAEELWAAGRRMRGER
jgi:hypothetical protein